MTISKRIHKTDFDRKFKKGLYFYLFSAGTVLVVGIAVLLLFPSRTKHLEATTVTSDSNTQTTSTKAIYDNSKVEIPVLMYHYIRVVTDPNDTVGKNLSVTPDTFNAQISWLKNNGYESIDFSTAQKIFANEVSASRKPIIITFDDGYKDAYTEAMPSLTKNKQTGTFYIISGFVNRDEFMSFDDISGLIENKMIIGCHTLDHLDLTTLNDAKLKSELVDCKESLHNVYNIPVTDFAYPSGKFNDSVIAATKAAGFKTAVTTKSGIWKQTDDPYQIPRLRMTESTNLVNVLK